MYLCVARINDYRSRKSKAIDLLQQIDSALHAHQCSEHELDRHTYQIPHLRL